MLRCVRSLFALFSRHPCISGRMPYAAGLWRARKCIPLQNYIHDAEFDWTRKLLFDYGHFVLLSGRPSISMNLILFLSLNSQCTPRKQYRTTNRGIITHHMPKAIPRPVKESLNESTSKYTDKEEELLGHCKLGMIPYDELSAATAEAAARKKKTRKRMTLGS